MSPCPVLSVIVIGRNEGERLTRCLESVRSMRSPDGGVVEIIYVDSGSNDSSVQLAARAGAQVISVTAARPCAAVGRNTGWHLREPISCSFLMAIRSSLRISCSIQFALSLIQRLRSFSATVARVTLTVRSSIGFSTSIGSHGLALRIIAEATRWCVAACSSRWADTTND